MAGLTEFFDDPQIEHTVKFEEVNRTYIIAIAAFLIFLVILGKKI